MEDISTTAQAVLMLYGFHFDRKLLIKEDLYGKKKKDMVLQICSSEGVPPKHQEQKRKQQRADWESAEQVIKDNISPILDIFAQIEWQ